MNPFARYFDLIREMRDRYNHRLRLIQYARQLGIKAAARALATTVPTVRKWLRRYQQQGPAGLIERSRAPHRQPRKTPAEVEQQVVALRQQLPTFGARLLIREFDLPLSHRALERIWRQHGLIPSAGENINASKTWPPSKPLGGCSSRSRPTPRTSTISRLTGHKPRRWNCRWSSTRRARCAAGSCS